MSRARSEKRGSPGGHDPARWLAARVAEISRLEPYTRPEKVDGAFKLDANENQALDREYISQIALQASRDTDLREYPLDEFERLYEQLAKYTGVGKKNIAVGSGSDQIFDLILSTLASGKRATMFTPSFSYFLNRCNLHRIKLEQVPLDSREFDLDSKAFLRSAMKSDVVYLCSPNNPTGNQLSARTLTELMDALEPEGKLLLIDEAYVDFADYSLTEEATGRSGIVVLRTLSKAFGLAGARVGYIVSNEEFANVFRSVIQSPYPVSSFSLKVAAAALSDAGPVKQTIAMVREERMRLSTMLAKIAGLKVFRSDANFIFFASGNLYGSIAKSLGKRKIVVKMIGDVAGYHGCIRVTVGTRKMNDVFLEGIQEAAR